MARTDDIINVAGHRLSTGAMEEVLAAHPDVAECAVVGVADEFKGQVPVGFVVLKAGVERRHEQIVAEVVQMVREQIGPVAAFKTATVVDRLPKTRSGKILRGDDATDRRWRSSTRCRPRSTIRRSSTRSARRYRRSGTRAREPTSNRMPSGYHENVPEEGKRMSRL